tara:strand:- start:1742 stop:1996 length:255 start_codon:yes stop_codon:yes gene_type:complete
MKAKTKKVLHECILKYMDRYDVKHLQDKNPFPVSWRTISSIKKSALLNDDKIFSRRTQRQLLDFFKLTYRLDGADFDVIQIPAV